MVRNPKDSQRILIWGINVALNYIYDLYTAKKKVNYDNLSGELSGHFGDKGISKKQIQQTVYKLKQRQYIAEEGDSVVLTNKAKMKLIDKFVEKTGKQGKKRLVSFDIPETKRIGRNKFRSAIKKMGYRQIQKSLWVCNQDSGELVESAALEYKVNDYVAYFIIEKSNIDSFIDLKLQKINNYFSLSPFLRRSSQKR